MQSDPSTYILAAGLLGAALGFFACALFASRTIRTERRSWWREGYGAANRDHHNRRL